MLPSRRPRGAPRARAAAAARAVWRGTPLRALDANAGGVEKKSHGVHFDGVSRPTILKKELDVHRSDAPIKTEGELHRTGAWRICAGGARTYVDGEGPRMRERASEKASEPHVEMTSTVRMRRSYMAWNCPPKRRYGEPSAAYLVELTPRLWPVSGSKMQ